MSHHALSRRIAEVLAVQPDAPAIEYDNQWFSWEQVAELAGHIEALGVRDRQVGILLRNRPAHVAALLGVLRGGGTVVVINPSRGDDRIRADIEALRLPLVIGAFVFFTVVTSTTTTIITTTNLYPHPCLLKLHNTSCN